METKQRRKLIKENLDLAEQALQRKLRSPSTLPDQSLVIPMSLLAGKNPLTQARWRLLMRVRSHGRYNRLQDLADELGRGKHRVSKDVDVLASLGLLHKQKQGRETAVRPDLRQIMVA